MIHIEALTFGYGRRTLFDGLELHLAPGSIAGLLGLNGAGKTSLLKLVAGALLPRSGRVEVFGRVPSKRQASHLAAVAFVPEDPWVPDLRPQAWVDQQAAFRPGFDRALFGRLTEEFQLEGDRSLSKQSFGQRKKYALAFALASGASTLLFDEPTDGLDIPAKVQFRRMLVEASRDDRVILVSTHQVRDLENLIDPVVIMDQGKVTFQLAVNELASELQKAGLGDLETLFTAAIQDPSRVTALTSRTAQGGVHA